MPAGSFCAILLQMIGTRNVLLPPAASSVPAEVVLSCASVLVLSAAALLGLAVVATEGSSAGVLLAAALAAAISFLLCPAQKSLKMLLK